jgi:chromosomal replication initiation ATPase DnaA
MQQLIFSLGWPVSPHDAWVATAGTAAAYKVLLDATVPIVSLYGVAGSGKSHLLALAAAQPEVRVWDDLERLGVGEVDELFHALQAALQGQGRVAVASRVAPGSLKVLADVQSRLLAGQVVEVLLPDDGELGEMMRRWAGLRQLVLPPAVVDYVLLRAERNPATLLGLLGQLDGLSLEHKRGISVPLARQIFGQG